MVNKAALGVSILLLIAWAMLMVAAADGPYVGWFKQKVGAVGYRSGWKGYSACDSDYNHCGSETTYDSTTCYKDALLAAAAFTIMAVILGFFVLVSAFLTAFQVGPPFYHFSMGTIALSFVTAIFCLLAWTIALGRVFDCINGTKPDVDHDPPFLIIAFVFYAIAAGVQFGARSK